MTDPLSELLSVAGVQGSLISRARLGCPFGVASTGAPNAIFHAPVIGAAWVRSGGTVERVEVGDVAVLPRGSAHDVMDAPSRVCRPLRSHRVETSDDRLPTVVDDAPEPALDLLCGTFSLGEPARRWLLDPLPDVFVVRAEGASAFVRATLGLLEGELATHGLGSTVLSNRLVEVLVIHFLREWARSADGPGAGWFAGMADPQLAQVMSAVHSDPAGDWSLDTMSRRMSRTRFAARFRDRLGTAPGTWLTEWRIAVARRALRDGADVARAAERAGYASEASFSRAFKRVVGVPPGSWRTGA
ncbi:MAG: AraC family transcriptional regulator [Alphaproteobacteria bacterium]|nr:AraC family transcriptional regulator [Alphaproteobacteria bacterium]